MSGEDTVLCEKVCDVVARTFDVDSTSVTTDLGIGEVDAWDSLGHLTLMMEVERAFSVRFSTEQIGQPKTVSEIAQLLTQVLANE